MLGRIVAKDNLKAAKCFAATISCETWIRVSKRDEKWVALVENPKCCAANERSEIALWPRTFSVWAFAKVKLTVQKQYSLELALLKVSVNTISTAVMAAEKVKSQNTIMNSKERWFDFSHHSVSYLRFFPLSFASRRESFDSHSSCIIPSTSRASLFSLR